MSHYLYRLGRFSFRHRWAVLCVWLIVLVGVGAAGLGMGGKLTDNFAIPGTESQRALDLLQHKLPQLAGAETQVVFATQGDITLTEPRVTDAIAKSVANLKAIPQVSFAAGPADTHVVSPDAHVGLGAVQYTVEASSVSDATLNAVEAAFTPARSVGVQVEYSGEVYPGSAIVVPETPEIIGIAAAFIILLITFGAVVAAGLPILTACIGVGMGALGVLAAAALTDMPSASLSLALMLGLSCGIDYALFILTRYRTELLRNPSERDGSAASAHDRATALEESAAMAVGTAGSAVVFAGLTVILALCGLAIVGIPFLTAMGLAAAATVAISLLIALTLLPALLGFAGVSVAKVISAPVRPGHAKEGAHIAAHAAHLTAGTRWGRFVVRYRVPLLVAGTATLIVIGLPTLSMHFGLPNGATQPPSSTARKAFDITAEHLGPGFNGPLLAVADLSNAKDPAAAVSLTAALKAEPGVLVAVPVVDQNGTAIIQLIPTTGPNDSATADLVKRIRADRANIEGSTGAHILVGGITASNIDTSAKLAAALPIFLLAVIGPAFVLLSIAFRTGMVPITSIIGFLLSVFAALGVQVAVFQWGWAAGILGITPGETSGFIPIIALAIIFGLSSDYEVFVVSRIKEQLAKTGDPQDAIRNGVGVSVRVVTAAGLIMFGVFISFIFGGDPTIKAIGLTLAAGVIFDALVVRLTLIPAVMSLLGRGMWSHFRFFVKYLPDLDIEGTALEAAREARLGTTTATDVPGVTA